MIVTDIYGAAQNVDESRRKLYSYSVKEKTITYNAPIIDENATTEFWTNYTEPMKEIPSIEERLQTWNNTILGAYAYAVDFNRDKNDASGEKWAALVKFVSENESSFFTKTGDFRKKFLISPEKLAKILA